MDMIEKLSFKAGLMTAFSEVVYREAKKIAFSSVLEPEEVEVICMIADKILKEYPIKYFLEEELIETNFSTQEKIKGKWVIIFYKFDKDIEKYHKLKEKVNNLKSHNSYDSMARREATEELCRLLGYSEEHIKELAG